MSAFRNAPELVLTLLVFAAALRALAFLLSGVLPIS